MQSQLLRFLIPLVAHEDVDIASPGRGDIHAPAIHRDGGRTFGKDIAPDVEVTAAANGDRRGDGFKEVVFDCDAAHAVVQVNGHRSTGSGGARMVDVVAADDATGVTTMLATYDMNTSAGSDTTGKSSSSLDIATTSANGKQFRLLRSAEDPENEDATAALASVIVVSNLNSFNGHN